MKILSTNKYNTMMETLKEYESKLEKVVAENLMKESTIKNLKKVNFELSNDNLELVSEIADLNKAIKRYEKTIEKQKNEIKDLKINVRQLAPQVTIVPLSTKEVKPKAKRNTKKGETK